MTSIVEIEELGRRIRKLRLERRLTLKQVETASGLSATHLSEIERGRTSPTIGALVRIARALEKEASYFIEHDERADVATVEQSSGARIRLPGGIEAESLTPGIPGSRVFAYRIRISAGKSTQVGVELQGDDAESIYFVQQGKLRSSFGDERMSLSVGDAVQISLAGPHVFQAMDEDAELLLVSTRSLPTAT